MTADEVRRDVLSFLNSEIGVDTAVDVGGNGKHSTLAEQPAVPARMPGAAKKPGKKR